MKDIKLDPNQPAMAIEQYDFGPEEYYKSKVYKKHLRNIAKLRHTTETLASTFGCGHCEQWKSIDKKTGTDYPEPITGEDLNTLGVCNLHQMETSAVQLCKLFYPDTAKKIPDGYARPRKDYGPKHTKVNE